MAGSLSSSIYNLYTKEIPTMFIYKLVVMLLIVVIFTGCFPGNVSYHDSFTKNGEVKVQNLEEVWIEMGYEQPTEWNYPYYFIQLTDAEENMKSSSIYRITIPIVFTTTKQPYGVRAGIDLCSNGYPADDGEFEKLSLHIDSLPSSIVTFGDQRMPAKALIVTTPSELAEKGLIDNNLTKGDICIFPRLNILYNTIQDKDNVKITADEMDKAISEYQEYIKKL